MTILKITAVLALAASALTLEPQTSNTEWADIEFTDGTPSIQGEVLYRWEQDGMEHIVLTNGEEYVISVEEIDFH